MSKILNGKIVADEIAAEVKNDVQANNRSLTLGIIQVGNHPASSIYIQYKIKMAAKLGVGVQHQKLPEDISQEKLLAIMDEWNRSSAITGYIVQLPLPAHLNTEAIINVINPAKDVDGLTAANKGALATNQPAILPATTRGIISLINYYQIQVAGQHVVVLGRSNLVGLPTALALLHRHATVTIIHSRSTDTDQLLRSADIIISAIGQPKHITKNMLASKAIVIDVGITNVEKKLYGDVDFDQVNGFVEAISPVPGGIGPLTVISLFQNLLDISLRG